MNYKEELAYYKELMNRVMHSAEAQRDEYQMAGNAYLASYYNGVAAGLKAAIEEIPCEEE